MAGHFVYSFETTLPTYEYEQKWEQYQGKPLLGEVVGKAHEAITAVEAFAVLPERNQKLVLDMADFAIAKANHIDDRWRENFWGLYIIGSRSRGDDRPDSDLDLLSAGTFYHNQGFADWYEDSVFEGFEVETPDELPSEYNTGDVDRKYLKRAMPKTDGVLPVDLSVVDLTFCRATLNSFKEKMDVAEDGSQLSRTPLFELIVPEDRHELHW